jgi:hypothetical protein
MPKMQTKYFSGASLVDSFVEVPIVLGGGAACNRPRRQIYRSKRNFIPVRGRPGSESDDAYDEEKESLTKKAKAETDTVCRLLPRAPEGADRGDHQLLWSAS